MVYLLLLHFLLVQLTFSLQGLGEVEQDYYVRLHEPFRSEAAAAGLSLRALPPPLSELGFYLFSPSLSGFPTSRVALDPRVSWHARVERRQRFRRCSGPDPYPVTSSVHLELLNLTGVWDSGNFGQGAAISVVDDGLAHATGDFDRSLYLPDASYDWADGDADPAPRSFERHGTECAGVAFGAHDNCRCGGGVAPGAFFAGQRLISAPTSDAEEALALSYRWDRVRVSTCSWGPRDDGERREAPGALTRAAVAAAAERHAHVFVWAAGNGRREGDDVNNDGYASSRYVLAVAAYSPQTESVAYYSEPGAAVLVAAPSSPPGVVSSAIEDGKCELSFGGTSAAAPAVAGVVALLLTARPELTWRDVQAVLLRTARRVDPDDAGWTRNGAGLWVHDSLGFGLVQAAPAVLLAREWMPLPPYEVLQSRDAPTEPRMVDDRRRQPLERKIAVEGDLVVEHVELRLRVAHSRRGELHVAVRSPQGTESVLATRCGDAGKNFEDWVFTSKRHFGERARGSWTLSITDEVPAESFAGNSEFHRGIYYSADLHLYGSL